MGTARGFQEFTGASWSHRITAGSWRGNSNSMTDVVGLYWQEPKVKGITSSANFTMHACLNEIWCYIVTPLTVNNLNVVRVTVGRYSWGSSAGAGTAPTMLSRNISTLLEHYTYFSIMLCLFHTMVQKWAEGPVILYFAKVRPCCSLTDDKYRISDLYSSSLGRCETTEEITELKKKSNLMIKAETVAMCWGNLTRQRSLIWNNSAVHASTLQVFFHFT